MTIATLIIFTIFLAYIPLGIRSSGIIDPQELIANTKTFYMNGAGPGCYWMVLTKHARK